MHITGLSSPDFSDLKLCDEPIYQGKANDVIRTNIPGVLAIRSTDRISAGNGERRDYITGKGRANHIISVEAFRRLAAADIPTHFLSALPNEPVKLVREATPIKLEVIGRYFTAGSFCREFCLPEKIPFSGPDGAPFVEFTFKSDTDGDPRITDYSIVKDGLLSREEVAYVRRITAEVGKILRDMFTECSCDFIDFKIEFGRLENGAIVVIDEISADTCRIRDHATGRKLDKDPFREGAENSAVVNGYTEIANRVRALPYD